MDFRGYKKPSWGRLVLLFVQGSHSEGLFEIKKDIKKKPSSFSERIDQK